MFTVAGAGLAWISLQRRSHAHRRGLAALQKTQIILPISGMLDLSMDLYGLGNPAVGQRLSISFIISSAQRTASAIALSVGEALANEVISQDALAPEPPEHPSDFDCTLAYTKIMLVVVLS